VEKLGERFVDLSAPYDSEMNEIMEQIASERKIKLHKGVYAAVVGPQLETRAEYRYLKIIGADAIGMSTIPEVIVANHLGLPVSALSVITDECDPDHLEAVEISEILAMAAKAEPDMITLFTELIKKI
jgi:purine-nucleoside phosphorylase